MTWTYSDALTENRDKVRWLVGDTDTNDQLVTDEQVAFALTQDSNLYRAAANVCDAIAVKVGQRLTTNAAGTGINAREQAELFRERAQSLRALAVTSGVSAFVGGISKSGKQSYEDDSDRVRPKFNRTLHDDTNGPDIRPVQEWP